SQAFHVNISFLHMATLMPVADVISAMPITFGGLGLRESTFVALLGDLAQVPRATAFSVSLIGYFVNTSWGLVGAAILPLFKGIVRDAREAASTAV
ncbi:MAG TPA: lysylphosphatidylglycerol synthase domain-containing protein, partial [Chthoniobacterales bacterium]